IFKPNGVAVDMGLSVKWASCNVGASAPEDYGDYFAWGETSPKSTYSWSTYKYCMGSSSTLTKYCNNSSYGYNGYTDTRTILDLSDDAARVNWGGSWRMPTAAEWRELMNTDNCTWTWMPQNIGGYEVISKKTGNSIFLSIGGYRDGLLRSWVHGYYWSSSLNTDDPTYAYLGYFTGPGEYDRGTGYTGRTGGRAVRAVTE
ncbi:MAG: hypothetical protein J5871_01515, partial [Bacteroidales bacterium]|nr:hypothetical protein [Bacteroidales bacterium]